MKGLRIVSIRLNFHEDEVNATASVTVEWSHSTASAASVLKLCGGLDLLPSAMLESGGVDRKALRTLRTFRFENREDALGVYDRFEEVLRSQNRDEMKVVYGAPG